MEKEIIKNVDMNYVNKMIENGYEAFGDLKVAMALMYDDPYLMPEKFDIYVYHELKVIDTTLYLITNDEPFAYISSSPCRRYRDHASRELAILLGWLPEGTKKEEDSIGPLYEKDRKKTQEILKKNL